MSNDFLISAEPPLIELNDLKGWILHEDDDLLVLDKPGWVVCHPSKNGPFSSLVGACREYTGLDTLHLVSRLDRETSGLIVLAKHKRMASICQKAVQERQVQKIYFALLEGELADAVTVNKQIARDGASPVHVKQAVRRSRTSKKATTIFEPLVTKCGFTFARVRLLTGRKHQIRLHAQWLGHSVVGDKIYGPDDTLYLEFIEHGWTPRLASALPFERQALHAGELTFEAEEFQRTFRAPLPEDIKRFGRERMDLELSAYENNS